MTNRSTTAGPDLTAHRLFGPRDAYPIQFVEFLERARVEHETEARCALGAYVVVRLADRWIELGSSGDREAFDWQSVSVRRHVGDLPQDRVDVAYLQDILRTLNRPQRHTDLRTALMAFTYLEHEGRTAEALATLRLAARTPGDSLPPAKFAKIALLAASLYHRSATQDRSHGAYIAAEEAAQCAGYVRLALMAVLGQARVLRDQRETAAARSLVERVLAAASRSRLEDIRSDAYDLLGTLLRLPGYPLQGIQAAYQAVRLANTPLARWLRLFDLGTALASQGYSAPARLAFLAAAASESRNVSAGANLELMDLASAAGDRLGFWSSGCDRTPSRFRLMVRSCRRRRPRRLSPKSRPG